MFELGIEIAELNMYRSYIFVYVYVEKKRLRISLYHGDMLQRIMISDLIWFFYYNWSTRHN